MPKIADRTNIHTVTVSQKHRRTQNIQLQLQRKKTLLQLNINLNTPKNAKLQLNRNIYKQNKYRHTLQKLKTPKM